VHPDRLCDLRPEVHGEKRVCDLLVPGVDAVLGRVLGQVVDEVAVVVQERGRDEARRGAVLLGRLGGLEHVLRHRDGLAEVGPRALLAEDAEDLVDHVAHRDSTASRLRSPSRSA
jgi:hypothetical protein